MYLKLAVYNALVNRVPEIREKYHNVHEQARGIGIILSWLYLLWLNIYLRIFPGIRKKNKISAGSFEEKLLYTRGSESSLSRKESPKEMADMLSEYDVISFDVFDTLVLRPFSTPSDLFFLVGQKLNYLDFERIRRELEAKARQNSFEKNGHYEVTFEEIYELIEDETGIPAKTAMKAEFTMEEELCFANPYMKAVVDILQKQNKRLILTSDMYLGKERIVRILETCGYGSFDACYVSCDYKASKHLGELFEIVKKKEGTGRRCIHVGDNPNSDVDMAKKHGFQACRYRNVNEAGRRYRAGEMSVITGSIYRGLVNSHIHNGLREFSRAYEYGFIYGGLFVTGYCQFIHSYVKKNNVERILFLSRDGYVLHSAYKILYGQKAESEKCRYVYWSRLAAVKLSAPYYKYDYFRRFLYHKINQGFSLKEIFDTMELLDMLPILCAELPLKPDTRLNEKNVNLVKEWLTAHWKEVLSHYEPQIKAGKAYYSQILSGCGKAVAIDIGWAGSGASALNYMVNQVWDLNCEITGILAGTNSRFSAEPDMSEPLLHNKKLVSYLFSQEHNRELWRLHNPDMGHNLYWEMFLSAPHGSLKGLYPDKRDGYKPVFKSVHTKDSTKEIQDGIMDFVKMYKARLKNWEEQGEISGRDAYAPMILAQSEGNKEFLKHFRGSMDEAGLT